MKPAHRFSITKPWHQGLAILMAALAAMTGNRLFGSPGAEWLIGALALLLFEAANPCLGFWAPKWWRYLLASLAVFAALFFLLPLGAMIISAKSYQDFGETAMVYLVVMYYPFTMALGGLARLVFHRGKAGGGKSPETPKAPL